MSGQENALDTTVQTIQTPPTTSLRESGGEEDLQLNTELLPPKKEEPETRLPIGTRIVLDLMPDDPQPITPGAQGTIRAYDDAGDILIAWDNGRGLHLIPGVDRYHILGSQPATAEQEMEISFKHLHDSQQKVGRDENGICPRCGRLFDLHRGGISRRVRAVNISLCSECSTQEAIEDFVVNADKMGLDANITVPKGLNLTGYDTKSANDASDDADGKQALDVKVKRLEDWWIVQRWQGRTDTADDHTERR